MTSRPAAPETETPEVDAALKSVEEHSHAHGLIRCANVADVARSLERRLSLAQTEIKGHMKIQDDLKRDIEVYKASIEKFGEQHGRELAKAQTRVAELEKERDTLKHHIAVSEALKDRA